MAEKNRTTLKTYFETGDTPTEDEFIDLIDSNVNIDEDITNGTEKATPVDADKFSLWDSVAGSLKTLSLANLKAAIGGGGEFQIYENWFFVDANPSANWVAIQSAFSTLEYYTNTGVPKGNSMTTVTGLALSGCRYAGQAIGNQTVESLIVTCNSSDMELLEGVTVVKATFTTYNTINSITELYRGNLTIDSFPNYNSRTIIPSSSFVETSISDKDFIFIFFSAGTTANIANCWYQFKTSID